MYKIIFAAALLALCPSFAVAGGGGGKNQTGTVQVNNKDQNFTVLVTIDNPQTQYPSLDALKAAGGLVIEADKSGSFTKVKAGSHTVRYRYLLDNMGTLSPVTTVPVNVTAGQTAVVNTVPVP